MARGPPRANGRAAHLLPESLQHGKWADRIGRATASRGVADDAAWIAAIMGHNGAGKTTLLRVAVGLISVKSGKVLLEGEDVMKMRPNRRVRKGLGYVPQGQLCFPQMTTMENLQLVSPHGVTYRRA